MLTNYKKIKDPTGRHKYELTADERQPVPSLEHFKPFREYLSKHPVDHPYIKIKDGVMTLKKGYRSDGASGWTIDTKNTFTGAYFHDGGYQSLRLGLLPQWCKEYFDLWFRMLLRDDGMSWIRSQYWWRGSLKCCC